MLHTKANRQLNTNVMWQIQVFIVFTIKLDFQSSRIFIHEMEKYSHLQEGRGIVRISNQVIEIIIGGIILITN